MSIIYSTVCTNAHYFNLYAGGCLCYLKQPCKSYNNKHNKDVELSGITSAESLKSSSLKLPNVKAEFLPLLSNLIILKWQLRLLDVIGEGYFTKLITSHLCIQLRMVNCVSTQVNLG